MSNYLFDLPILTNENEDDFDRGEDFTTTSFNDAFDMYMNEDLQATLECCSYDENYKKAVMDMQNDLFNSAVTMIIMHHIIRAHATRLAEQYLEDEKL